MSCNHLWIGVGFTADGEVRIECDHCGEKKQVSQQVYNVGEFRSVDEIQEENRRTYPSDELLRKLFGRT